MVHLALEISLSENGKPKANKYQGNGRNIPKPKTKSNFYPAKNPNIKPNFTKKVPAHDSDKIPRKYQEIWDRNTKYRFGIGIFLVKIPNLWLPIDITTWHRSFMHHGCIFMFCSSCLSWRFSFRSVIVYQWKCENQIKVLQKSDSDPDVIWTRNLLIWSQTRYRCATESLDGHEKFVQIGIGQLDMRYVIFYLSTQVWLLPAPRFSVSTRGVQKVRGPTMKEHR